MWQQGSGVGCHVEAGCYVASGYKRGLQCGSRVQELLCGSRVREEAAMW